MFWKNRFFAAETALSYSGRGISIAVLDTGISPAADFIEPNNRIAAFVDLVGGRTEPYDDNGHGTQLTDAKTAKTPSSMNTEKGVFYVIHAVSLSVITKHTKCCYQNHTTTDQILHHFFPNRHSFTPSLCSLSQER